MTTRDRGNRCRRPSRFPDTLAVSVAFLTLIAFALSASVETEEREVITTPETLIFDFGDAAEPWPSIDDPVMGGRSRSRMSLKGGVAVFEGMVSLENNGGFASTRSRPAGYDLRGFDGLALRVRGDGKVYGVRLRTSTTFDGVSYQASITTEAGRWREIRIPFATFEPGFRGRKLRDYPALDTGKIRSFGLIISDQQEGPFRLEIDSIKAYRNKRQAALESSP